MLANECHPEDRRVRKRLGSRSAGAAEFAMPRPRPGILRAYYGPTAGSMVLKGNSVRKLTLIFHRFDVPEQSPDPAPGVGRTWVERVPRGCSGGWPRGMEEEVDGWG